MKIEIKQWYKFILPCFCLAMVLTSSDEVLAVSSQDSAILKYRFVYHESEPESVVAKLVDDDDDPLPGALITCSQLNRSGKTLSSSRLSTDSKGLATCYIKDDTVSKIKLLYREESCLIVNIRHEAGVPSQTFISSSLSALSAVIAAGSMGVSALGAAAMQLGLKDYIFVLINYLLSALAISKKTKMGIVYDSSTHKPVPGAIVHLYAVPEYRLISSAITNSHGGYVFSAGEGEYALSVAKPGFQFPSKMANSLGDTSSAYVGQIFRVGRSNPAVNALIPIDPDANSSIILSRFYRVTHNGFFRYVLLVFSSVTSVYSLWNDPSLFSYFLCGAIAFLWVMELITFSRVIRYSKVVDNNDQKPVGLALLRVMDNEGKLDETFVSDASGRVLPRVNQREQKIMVEKNGYHTAEFTPNRIGVIERKKFEILKK